MHPLRSAGLGTLFRSQDHDVFPLLSSVAAEEADAPGSFPVKSPEPNVTRVPPEPIEAEKAPGRIMAPGVVPPRERIDVLLDLT